MNGSERSEPSSLPDGLLNALPLVQMRKPGKIYQTDTSWQMWGVSMVSEAVNSGKYFCYLGLSQDLALELGFQSL